MNWKPFKKRDASAPPRRAAAPFRLPSAVLEVQPDFVVAAKLDGSAHRVQHIGVNGLEAGVIRPDPGRSNIVNGASLRDAVRAASRLAGNGAWQAGLLVPDGTVRVSVLPFETIPENEREFDALVQWRMEQSLACSAEEFRLSYQVSRLEPTGFEILALAMKNSVVREYESALEETNRGFALILPVTAALLPLLPIEAGAQLLLNVCCGWMTSVVACANRVCFWRTREVGHDNPGDARRAVFTEAARVLASARDHMNLEIGRTWLCVRPRVGREFFDDLGATIKQEVAVLAPRSESGATLQHQERSVFEDFGAAIGGLLMNH